MSDRRRQRRLACRREWGHRRAALRQLRRAVEDATLRWDEAVQLLRLAFESVGGNAPSAAFLREVGFWWHAALDGGPRRRALKRLQRTSAFPWSGERAEPTRSA